MPLFFKRPLAQLLGPVSQKAADQVRSIKNTKIVDMPDAVIEATANHIANALKITNLPQLGDNQARVERNGTYYLHVSALSGDKDLLDYQSSTLCYENTQVDIIEKDAILFDIGNNPNAQQLDQNEQFKVQHNLKQFRENIKNLNADITAFNDGGGTYGPGLVAQVTKLLVERRAKAQTRRKELESAKIPFNDSSNID